MKKKSKIDQKAIQQFFIDHTEKIVMGLVAVLVVFFAYKSFSLESYKHSPKALQDAVNRAQSTIQRGPQHKTPDTECPLIPYDRMVEAFKSPIEPSRYATAMSNPFDWKPYAPRRTRDAPVVFPVEKLRAIAGRGALLAPGNSATPTVGQRWVVVTGLVPYRNEVEEYIKDFKGAADESNMTPRYYGFLVQRGEIEPGSKGEPNWEKNLTFCNAKTLAEQMGKWSGASQEVVNPRYTLDCLTSPLPPLASGDWGNEVACPPQIKVELKPVSAPTENGPGGPGITGPGGPPVRNTGPGGPPMQSGRRFAPGERGGASIAGEFVPNGPNGAVGIDPALGGGFAPPPGASRGPPPGAGFAPPPGAASGSGNLNAVDPLLGAGNAQKPGETKTKADEESQVPEFLLLRYFDFDAEPGKQYAYRFFVLLHNPNYGLPANVLNEAELARAPLMGVKPNTEKYEDGKFVFVVTNPRDAKWSDYCISSKPPKGMRLLAGPTSPAKVGSSAEPTGEARILLWLEKTGASGSFSKSGLLRGTVLDFPDAAMSLPDESNRPKVDLESNCMLVDLAGGELIAPKERDKSPISPGMMLVLDQNGNLVIHDEMSETKEWADATKDLGDGRERRPRRTHKGRETTREKGFGPPPQGFAPPPAGGFGPNPYTTPDIDRSGVRDRPRSGR